MFLENSIDHPFTKKNVLPNMCVKKVDFVRFTQCNSLFDKKSCRLDGLGLFKLQKLHFLHTKTKELSLDTMQFIQNAPVITALFK